MIAKQSVYRKSPIGFHVGTNAFPLWMGAKRELAEFVQLIYDFKQVFWRATSWQSMCWLVWTLRWPSLFPQTFLRLLECALWVVPIPSWFRYCEWNSLALMGRAPPGGGWDARTLTVRSIRDRRQTPEVRWHLRKIDRLSLFVRSRVETTGSAIPRLGRAEREAYARYVDLSLFGRTAPAWYLPQSRLPDLGMAKLRASLIVENMRTEKRLQKLPLPFFVKLRYTQKEKRLRWVTRFQTAVLLRPCLATSKNDSKFKSSNVLLIWWTPERYPTLLKALRKRCINYNVQNPATKTCICFLAGYRRAHFPTVSPLFSDASVTKQTELLRFSDGGWNNARSGCPGHMKLEMATAVEVPIFKVQCCATVCFHFWCKIAAQTSKTEHEHPFRTF